MVVAPKGKQLIMCDLSQAESWIVAFKSGDENMKHSLMFSDIHSDTARVLFSETLQLYEPEQVIWKVTPFLEMRYVGKRNNHANGYGMQAERNAQVINKDSDKPPYVTVTVSQCREYQERWHGHYYRIKEWHLWVQDKLNQDRTLITTYGRKRVFYGPWGNELFKQAYAHEPQSTVADHFNGATHPELGIRGGLLEIYKQIAKPSNGEINIINQSHDSCMLECPNELVSETANKVMDLLHRPLVLNGEEFWIPVDCEVGDRWGEMEGFGHRNKYKEAA